MKVNNTLAKALYDNKAECSDELAFRKGDILTVLDQNVIGSDGWWKCSLHGRQGLAPANRLQLLAASQAVLLPPSTRSDSAESPAGQQNIYQVPSVPKPTVSSSTYEKMEGWVKSPARVSTLPAQGIYQVPALAAQLLSEKTKSSTSQLSRDAKSEQDRLSVSSMDSRSSTLSTSSKSSAESSSTSSSEEPAKEVKLDLDVAIETLTKLQHSVSSSVASLMIFVSSKWRLQEHLEKSIEEIHRAVDHIKVSLGEFLAFAQVIKVNASYLTDSNLQTRIKKQLEILMNSSQILTETREALNNCNWSLEALILRKPQNNPDDLDRFVMVARTIPDDIKRFVSIIIANGKLLFRKNEKEPETKQSKVHPEYKMAKQIIVPRKIEIDSLQRNAPDKPNQSQVSSEKPQENATEDCDYVQLQVSITAFYCLYS
ncbi:cas scaffolding protein family member 4 [Limosa lapponica baueri]|uniref:Cas scaffolding protein family member 4 n=1 Tax=Limosa lapponica baueri TaxID=1758121 RepID=A0A2I0TB94_LIMLA|nr:cas scaffolding protein family member 4 [Limosa lapponica baueri]